MDALFVAAVLLLAAATPAHAFELKAFSARAVDNADHDVTQAGAHPFFGITYFEFNTTLLGFPDEHVKDVRVDVPPGLISNPQATPRCTNAQFPGCPANTQIGTVTLTTALPLPVTENVYNMQTTPDQVSVFAFNTPFGRTDIVGGVRDDSDYGLFFTIKDIPEIANLVSSELDFWGVPSQHGGASTTPFISLPTECGVKGTSTINVTTYEGHSATKPWDTDPLGGCPQVPFDPSIDVQPGTTQADEPTSAAVKLSVPDAMTGVPYAAAQVKDVSVTLPAGMTINPAAANGLAGCSDPSTCPPASQIGTVEISTPVLPDNLTGAVYLGRPLPADPYRLFVVAHGPNFTVKLTGSVHPDPQTGQLTATFNDTPRVPFTDFKLTFNGGPNATLATPLECGSATTTGALTPYTGEPPVTKQDSFTVDADGSGGACPQTPPFNLGFAAGTQDNHAGAFSPFTVTVTRDDRQQFLSRLSVRQPPGMLGVLSSVPLCGDADAANGTCPDASRIGTSSVKSGAGPQPFALSGPVYLTGPYNGAPFGLSIAIRAVAGPFDLGTVVVRAAIHVDSTDSHLTIDADPLPQILQGIPLRLREVSVVVDRQGFIFNPSTCDPLAIHGTLTAVDGTVQEADSPFQATGCADLPFSPKLSATADGKTSQASGASLKVTLTQPAHQANVRSVSVQLPKRLTARPTTLQTACPEAMFAADTAGCANALVGTVHAETPLLSGPLNGPVYLVAHGATFPSLEALLQGQGLNIHLSGTVTFGSDRLSSAFNTVPDVPITSFVLNLPKGPHSALSASKGLCGGGLTMPTTIVGQNGARLQANTPISVTHCGIKILRARVMKSTAILTVQVSQLGKLTGRGKGLRTGSRRVTKGGNVQLKLRLSKSGKRLRAKRHRQHKHLKVKITVRLANQVARKTVRFK
jgi:hypothetical protein